MFGPKNTVESVARKLIEGLDDGSIVLRSDNLPNVDVAAFKNQLEIELADARKKERLQIVFCAAISLLGLLASIVSMLISYWTASRAEPISLAYILLVSVLVLIVVGIVLAWQVYRVIKSRERTVQLKTYFRVLNSADDETARKLARRLPSSMTGRKMAASN